MGRMDSPHGVAVYSLLRLDTSVVYFKPHKERRKHASFAQFSKYKCFNIRTARLDSTEGAVCDVMKLR